MFCFITELNFVLFYLFTTVKKRPCLRVILVTAQSLLRVAAWQLPLKVDSQGETGLNSPLKRLGCALPFAYTNTLCFTGVMTEKRPAHVMLCCLIHIDQENKFYHQQQKMIRILYMYIYCF